MATTQAPQSGSVSDRAWEQALHQLSETGVLPRGAADSVRTEHDKIVEQQSGRRNRGRIVELAGYAGAALTVLGVTGISSQLWDDFDTSVQALALAGLAVGLAAAAIGVALTAPGGIAGTRGAGSVARTRLVGVLGTAAAVLFAGTAAVIIDAVSGDGIGPRLWQVFAVLLVGSALTAWLAPGAAPTLGVGAGLLGTVLAGVDSLGLTDNQLTPGLALIALGVFSGLVLPRVLRPPALVEALSIALWLSAAAMTLDAGVGGFGDQQDAVGAEWVGRLALLALLVVGAGLFVRGGRWPWAAGAALALPIWVQIEFAGALGGAVAMIMAGLALVAISVVLTVSRRTRRAVAQDEFPDERDADVAVGAPPEGR